MKNPLILSLLCTASAAHWIHTATRSATPAVKPDQAAVRTAVKTLLPVSTKSLSPRLTTSTSTRTFGKISHAMGSEATGGELILVNGSGTPVCELNGMTNAPVDASSLSLNESEQGETALEAEELHSHESKEMEPAAGGMAEGARIEEGRSSGSGADPAGEVAAQAGNAATEAAQVPELQLAFLPNGTPKLSFVAQPDHTYTIERSTDLNTWVQVATIPLGSAQVTVLDNNASLLPNAFFRIQAK